MTKIISEVKVEKVISKEKLVQCPDCPYPTPQCYEEAKAKEKLNKKID